MKTGKLFSAVDKWSRGLSIAKKKFAMAIPW